MQNAFLLECHAYCLFEVQFPRKSGLPRTLGCRENQISLYLKILEGCHKYSQLCTIIYVLKYSFIKPKADLIVSERPFTSKFLFFIENVFSILVLSYQMDEYNIHYFLSFWKLQWLEFSCDAKLTIFYHVLFCVLNLHICF